MTMAASRPHDLFFWEEPKEMMAGSVDAPGVFLNASAVLERQLTAFSLDCWVREAGKSASIPGEIRSVFNAIRGQALSKFPYPRQQMICSSLGMHTSAFIGTKSYSVAPASKCVVAAVA
jgi:hypothetical protein